MVHVPSFFDELEALKQKGLDTNDRIFISDRAHVTFDLHKVLDGLEEEELAGSAVGTTKKGIGPTYSVSFVHNLIYSCHPPLEQTIFLGDLEEPMDNLC